MELGSVTLKRIGFFCFPIKHSTHTPSHPASPSHTLVWYLSLTLSSVLSSLLPVEPSPEKPTKVVSKASAAPAKAAAAKEKKSANTDEESDPDSEVMPSDSEEEEAMPAKKAQPLRKRTAKLRLQSCL